MSYNMNNRSCAVNSQLGSLGCEYAHKMKKKKKETFSLEQIHTGTFFCFHLLELICANVTRVSIY